MALQRSTTSTITRVVTDPTTQFRVTVDPLAQTVFIAAFYDDGTSEGWALAFTDPAFTASDITNMRTALRNIVRAALTAKGFA